MDCIDDVTPRIEAKRGVYIRCAGVSSESRALAVFCSLIKLILSTWKVDVMTKVLSSKISYGNITVSKLLFLNTKEAEDCGKKISGSGGHGFDPLSGSEEREKE
ncbi:hypothetical protein DPMN_054592 [Dreissena polymorpha]|uniref:Uncharacterized protein n=1 Tax=Dreissena polymorpha TaxID=45954 RepID=A0A9D4CQN0_DREPO|nr:hypothetical protein DPMN_054592 [Dreissena polymorpha]